MPTSDSVVVTYRRSVAGLFGLPMAVFGLVSVVFAAVGPLTTFGRLFNAAAGVAFVATAYQSLLRHWFVRVTLMDDGLIVSDRLGRPRATLPWPAVTVTSTKRRNRLVLIANRPYSVRQELWPQLWPAFGDAVAWMRDRPHVLQRWDASALDAYSVSTKAAADFAAEQEDRDRRRRGNA